MVSPALPGAPRQTLKGATQVAPFLLFGRAIDTVHAPVRHF
jgi:hypothetical protein